MNSLLPSWCSRLAGSLASCKSCRVPLAVVLMGALLIGSILVTSRLVAAAMATALALAGLGLVAYRRARRPHAAQALPIQRSTLALAFENANEAIQITDAQARILLVNRAYEAITGYSASEVLGKNPSFQKSGRQDEAFYQAMWAQLNQHGTWQGEIWNRRKNGEDYAAWQSISAIKDASGRLTHFVSMFSDITASKMAEARLHHLAHHDPLTHLPNRLMFDAALERAAAQARRHQRRLALMCIDLDHFKHINDTLGHPAGDQLLETVAQRLRGGIRNQDIVARRGGDEFTVLITDAGTRDDIAHLAHKLVGMLTDPMQLEGHRVLVSASIGIAMFPDDAPTPEALIRAADAALYRSKANGRRTFGFYTEELTRLANERLAIERQLHRALEVSELRLHYQPQLSMRGELLGFEALLRWQHPEQGLLPPERFLPVVEQSNLSQAIGDWVLREACRQTRQWLNAGLQPRRMAINLSTRQFLDDQFMTTVQQALQASRLDDPTCGVRFQLEVREPILQKGGSRSDRILKDLNRTGVDIVVDDFGAGHSCLNSLQHWPLRALKIDAAFVRGLPADRRNLAIAQAIIALARPLGLEVVAEGVETPAQRDFLWALGCTAMQGFLMSRPLQPEGAAAYLRACVPRHAPIPCEA